MVISPSGDGPSVPLDEMAKTPKELQPFGQFVEDHNAAITPFGDDHERAHRGFQFPTAIDERERDRNTINISDRRSESVEREHHDEETGHDPASRMDDDRH